MRFRFLKYFIIIFLIIPCILKSQEKKIGIGINIGYQFLKMNDFNSFIENNPETNLDLIYTFANSNPSEETTNIINGCPNYSTSIIYKPFTKFNIVFIGQFEYCKTNALYELIVNDTAHNQIYSYKYDYSLKNSIISFTPLFTHSFNEKLNINTGFGLLYNFTTISENKSNSIDGNAYSEGNENDEKKQLRCQILAGFEYKIFKNIYLNLDIAYKLNKIRLDRTENNYLQGISTIDLWVMQNNRFMELDYSGLNINMGIRYYLFKN